MVHVIFDINSVNFEDFFNENQYGGNLYFEGIPYQRGFGKNQVGRGIGNVLGSIWRLASPALKKVAPIVGNEVLEASKRILSDISSGKSFTNAAAENLSSTVSKVKQVGGGKKRRIEGRGFAIGDVYQFPLKGKRKRKDIFD